MHIFLDSSVLLAFCRSKRGAAALIIDYCIQGKLNAYVSKKVIFEVKNNNLKDNSEVGARRFEEVLRRNILTVIEDASEEELAKAQRALHNPKDEPIIAAAKQTTQITYILSHDNGFFKNEVIAFVKPQIILKPGEFINRFQFALKDE